MPNPTRIPTANPFQGHTGRSGAGRVFKRRDDLDPIFEALETHDSARGFCGDAAVKMLRTTRRSAIAWPGAGGHRGAAPSGAAMATVPDHFPPRRTQGPHVPKWPASMR